MARRRSGQDTSAPYCSLIWSGAGQGDAQRSMPWQSMVSAIPASRRRRTSSCKARRLSAGRTAISAAWGCPAMPAWPRAPSRSRARVATSGAMPTLSTTSYRPWTGDGTITARVVSLQNTDGWAKAGVMLRETLDPASAYAFSLVSAGNGTHLQWRAAAAPRARMNSAGPASGAPPTGCDWCARGNNFSAYAAPDGGTVPPPAAAFTLMTNAVDPDGHDDLRRFSP